MTPDQAAAEALLARYLDALADPAAGAAFHALHAPDASLLVAGRPVRADQIAPEAFAASHAAPSDAGFPTGPFTIEAWQPEALAAEARTGDPGPGRSWGVMGFTVAGVRAMLGLVQVGSDWRVAFATLAPEGALPDFRTGRARELMAFPSLTPGDRAWLDVAYRRAYLPARPALATLPGERFACQGSTHCCRVGEAVVPREAQAFIDAVPWEKIAPELAGTQLPVRPDGQLVVKGAQEACRFLDEAGRCRIHAYFGEPVFTPCVVFPFRFTRTPDGVAVTTAYSCGSARGGLGPELAERPEELIYRYNRAGDMLRLDRPRLRPDDEPDWEAYRAAEADLFAALAYEGLPLHRQLWVGARLLEARLAGAPGDADRAALEPLGPCGPAERKAVEATLAYTVGTLAMLDPAFEPATALEVASIRLSQENEVRRWFRTVLFAKDLANEFGLVGAFALLAHMYVFLLAAGPDAPREVLYQAVDQRLLVPTFQRLLELLPALRAELGDPDAVKRLLRYASDRAAART